jgi:ParB-like chromosome segregation protein Spo0J
MTKDQLKEVIAAMADEVREYVERETAPLEKRIADLQGLVDKGAVERESLERRLSRHADHLAGLESRTKKLERSG